jgi:hypothetical protein
MMGATLTQAMKELQKLQALHERRPGVGRRDLSEVEVARTISFVINQAAWGKATPAQRGKLSRFISRSTRRRRKT